MGSPRGSVRTQTPGLAPEYNHDLNVADAFLAGFPLIRTALKDQRLLNAFGSYEAEAKLHKRRFHRLGLLSLLCALLALISSGAAAIIGQSISNKLPRTSALVEFGSVISIVLIVWNRAARHRVRWCEAVFCRERLRQWHFQLFLDGQLMGLLVDQPAAFHKELDRRWGLLQQNLRDGYGAMAAFVHHGSRADDFFHQPSAYPDASLARIALEALWILRIGHQLRYGQRKIEPTGELAELALDEHASLSETVASFTLAGAVVVGALGFALSLSHLVPGFGPLSQNVDATSRVLSGSALLLAVLSAASRAYRAGYTLPDEAESYKEYSDRIRELKAVFESTGSLEVKLWQLAHLEAESVKELRRFLRMKMRATFVF